MMNEMLAPEMLAHTTAPRALAVGDLAVFTDYRGRTIGCSVTRIWAAGAISSTAQVEVKVVGNQHAYYNGMKLVVEASVVRGAL